MLARRDAVLIDRQCSRLITGFTSSYVYQEVFGSVGEFKPRPLKNKFSHCLVGSTKVFVGEGTKRIDSIHVGDLVVTPVGLKRVTATMSRPNESLTVVELSNGKKILCTFDHPFITPKGIVLAVDLHYNTLLIGEGSREEFIWADRRSIQFRSSLARAIIESLRDTIRLIGVWVDVTCTGLFGSISRVLFPRVFAFTTSTVTRRTIGSRISNSSRNQTTRSSTSKKTIERFRSKWAEASWLQGSLPSRGTDQKKEERGIERTQGNGGERQRRNDSSVWSVVKDIGAILRHAKEAFVLWRVSRLCVAESIRVKSVSTEKSNERVYDLTVEDEHVFFANGVLVGNCHDALQYVMVKLFPPIIRNKPGADPYHGFRKDYPGQVFDYEPDAEVDWDSRWG
jgi:hypothetical protein